METEGGSSCCRSHQWVLMDVCILSLSLENGECVCVCVFLLNCAGAAVTVGGGEIKGIHMEGT